MRIWWAAALGLVAACGPPAVDTGTPAAPAPSASPSGTASAPVGDDAPHPENDAYRSRFPASPGADVDADEAVRVATEAVEALAQRVAGPTSRQVSDALVAAGFPSASVQVYDGSGSYDTPSSVHAIGIDLGGVCVTGGLRDQVVSLSVAGGYIADGGCLAAS